MIRGLDEELTAHKYAHVERERRFLVDPLRRPDLSDQVSILIEDLYIDGTRMRLRRMTDSTGRVVTKLSKKYDVQDVLNRPLVTTYLTEAEYALIATLPARPLVKRRFLVATSFGEFGIDLFEGALTGLELAEIEASDASILSKVEMPFWALREVTHDARYQGGNLAMLAVDDVASLR